MDFSSSNQPTAADLFTVAIAKQHFLMETVIYIYISDSTVPFSLIHCSLLARICITATRDVITWKRSDGISLCDGLLLVSRLCVSFAFDPLEYSHQSNTMVVIVIQSVTIIYYNVIRSSITLGNNFERKIC